MKSVKTDKTDDVVYPCLMSSNLGVVVLFTEDRIGTLVSDSQIDPIGYHSKDWYMPNFTPYTGTVTLSN